LGMVDNDNMAYAYTSAGNPQYGSSYDDNIYYPTINNSQYSYWVVWSLAPDHIDTPCSMKGYDVVLEYTSPAQATHPNRLSVSAAAFVPHEDGYDFEDHGRLLFHLHSPNGGTANGWYYAPVELPQGVTITGMLSYMFDESNDNGLVKLQRTHLGQGDYQNMATCVSFAWGFGIVAPDVITGATIDNTRYAYWLVWDLPVAAGTNPHPSPGDVLGNGVILEYSYEVWLPLISRGP
jgi:hypothetical protein